MCKKSFISLVLVLAVAASQAALAQVSQKKLATLGPNESIVTDESVLLAGTGAGCAVDDFFLVTQTSRSGKTQFFIYDKSGSTFWIDDAAHYAWIESDKLLFSDGASFPYPVMMKFEKKGGKTTLCWVSLKDNGDVVVYSRPL